jgi:ArsR family transcriptional regulator, arsenate/arsenite/antimonite-responsive transcriptional repressor
VSNPPAVDGASGQDRAGGDHNRADQDRAHDDRADDNRAAGNRPERELADRVAQLESRISALEGVAGGPAAGQPPLPVRPAVAATADGPDDEPDGPAVDAPLEAGQVGYAGEVTLYGRVVWNISLGAQNILDLPNARSPAVLAGLGHPTRAALTRRLLAGPATTAELQQVVEGSSTGQLYHHLRTMTACGLAEQDGRGQYRVPPTAVVPAMVLLLAAADIAGDLR